MIKNISHYRGLKIDAIDGEIGKVKDVLFDDVHWTMRYFVVEAGTWLASRIVLISPAAIRKGPDRAHSLPVNLTRRQVLDSPEMQSDLGVSRQYEVELVEYFGWPAYWESPYAVGQLPLGAIPVVPVNQPVQAPRTPTGDPNLRSLHEVTGYRIHAADGHIGHVEDFLVDDADWNVRYLVVDTRNYLPSHRVLVSPMWVQSVSWLERSVTTDLHKISIKHAPPYDPSAALTRQYEEQLFDYYGRPGYWRVAEPAEQSGW